jgi:hypothetical protein
MNANRYKFFLGIFCLLLLLLAAPTPCRAESRNPITNGKTWTQMSPVEKVQMVCVLSVLPVAFIAEIMFIVAGFKSSVGWGLFMLFIGGMRSVFVALGMIVWMVQWMLLTHDHESVKLPSLIFGSFVLFAGGGAIIFMFRHWEHARKPLAMMGLGAVLILTVLALQFAK